MYNPILILAKNYRDEEAIFIPYENIGKISVIADGKTESGEQHYSVVFLDKDNDELARNQGFPSFDRAMEGVRRLGINITECC